MCADCQTFAQPNLRMALKTLGGTGVCFDFPWLVFFPLSVFMVIKIAAVDLRALTGLCCVEDAQGGMMCKLCSQ